MRHVGQVIRTMPAPGPPWDRIVAWALGLNLTANNMSLNCCSVRLDASCCQPGLRLPGSKSSMSRAGGLAVKRAVRNHGPPTNCLAASAAAPKLGVSGSPSNSDTICRATSGWRACTIGRQSAQLLQWAGTRVRTALRSPNPLMDNGNDADAFIPASSPRPESEPSTPKSGGHGCERNVPLNQGSQPAEENWHVQPHNATE